MSLRFREKYLRKFITMSFCLMFTVLSVVSVFVTGSDAFAQNRPSWAQEFYGEVTFRLLDDRLYREKYENLTDLYRELQETRQLHASKVQALESKNAAKEKKIQDLNTAQTSLDQKSRKKDQNSRDIETADVTVLAMDNAIVAAQNNISDRDRELTNLQGLVQTVQDAYDAAVDAQAAKQQAYDSTLQACEDDPARTNCLDDDAVIAAKVRLDQAKEVTRRKQDQLTELNRQVAELEASVAESQATIASSTRAKEEAIANKTRLAQENERLQLEIDGLIASIGTITADIDKLQVQITALSRDVTDIGNLLATNEVTYTQQNNEFETYKAQLIEDVLGANRLGFEKANADGARDGIEVARTTGDDIGERYGARDGRAQGEREGREREYRRGAQEGEAQGATDGRQEGTDQGQVKGKEAGWAEAGSRDGEIEGLRRAEGSDANRVGTRQGNQNGQARAEAEGRRQGTALGEQQSIQKNENQRLNSSEANGPFAGSFQPNVQLPAFPGATRRYYDDESGQSRQILRLAYIAGYQVTYDAAAAQTYQQNIQPIFEEAYNRTYTTNYQSYVNRDYPESYRQGREEQYQAAYDREYQPAYSAAFTIAKAAALENPDTRSSIYRNSRATSETSAYERRYEEIRSAAEQIANENTFNQNIAGETEKYRTQRKAEVDRLYTRFPVLKFETASFVDAGTRGVGANDGITMPGETVVSTVMITNYGLAAATGVKIITEKGTVATLPAIPGRSSVVVKGASKTTMPSSLNRGQRYTAKIDLTYVLQSEDKKIQGRHFANRGDNKLAANVSAVQTADFPFTVEQVALTTPLVLGQPSGLTASLKNKSTRNYTGPITVELESTQGPSVFTSQFQPLSSIAQTATLEGANVLFNDQEDIFTEVSFSLALYKNGVLLGYISNTGGDYVKVPYTEKEGKPVVVVKSQSRSSREAVKDITSQLGGAGELSILDMNAGSVHQTILNQRMEGKTLIVVSNDRDRTENLLDTALEQKNIAVVLLNDGASEVSFRELKKLGNMEDATTFDLVLDRETIQVLSSSQYARRNLKQNTSFIKSDIRDLAEALGTAEILKLNNDQLLAKLASESSIDSFLRGEARVKKTGKVMIMRAIEEGLAINKAYVDSDGSGRFLFWDLKDKEIYKDIPKVEFLMINKMSKAIKSGDQATKQASALLSYAMEDGVEKAQKGDAGIAKHEKRIRKAFSKVMSKTSKEAKKVLKNGKVYKKAEEAATQYFPFANY